MFANLPWLLVLAVALTISPGAAGAESATVVRIVDGDTFDVRFRDGRTERVRLEAARGVWIDAPETGDRAKCQRERELGAKATERVTTLLQAREVDIAAKAARDRYGRTVARVTLGGRDLGGMLVAEGIARTYTAAGKKPDWCR